MKYPPVPRGTLLAAFLACSIVCTLAPAGRTAADERVAAEALAPGSWSVQFSVQPNFTLGSYAGSTLSLKRHLASGNALRFGVSLDFGGQSDDFADANADTFSTRTQLNTTDGHNWSIGLGTYYLWYSRRAAPLHAYMGTGPTVSISRGHTEQSQAQTLTPTGQPSLTVIRVDESTNRAWQVGIAGTAGIEWLVSRRIGVFAEYGSSLAYTSTVMSRRSTITQPGSGTSTDRLDGDTHRWSFSGSGGRLGISAYY